MEEPLKEFHIVGFDEFLLLEKINYAKTYTKKNIVDHLKAFKRLTVDPADIDKKMLNFYNYSVNYLHKKYPGYNIEKTSEEGPADEEYMKILNKLALKLK